MRSQLAAGQHGGAARLDSDDVQVRVAPAQVLADAGDGAARPDARHEHVHTTVERARDLGTGPAPVRLGIGRVGELVGQEHVLARRHRACGVDRLVHAAERLGELDAGPIEPQQRLALAAHPVRKRQDQVVALGRAHERERDAGVAARRLHDRGAPRLDPPLRLGGLDHRDADSVLDAAARVEGLELGEQPYLGLRCRPLEHGRDLHQRRVPD